MFVPGCMWHVMHWLDGIDRVNTCFIGWPGSLFENRRIARRDWPFVAELPRTAPSERAIGRWRRRRGRRCSRCRDSRPADRSCPGNDSSGSSRRVFCSPRKTGSVRSCVPKPRSLSFTSGRPGSSSRAGLPISPRLPAAALEHAQHVARLRDFPPRQRIEKRQKPFVRVSSAVGGGKVTQPLRRAVRRVALAEARVLVRDTRRCCRAPRPRASRRASSCSCARCCTSAAWHWPHVRSATRRSPGLTNWMYSGDSRSHSV